MDWDYSPPESENGGDEDENLISDLEDDGSGTDDGEPREFDRNLPTEHSYLPGELVTTQGRSVLEAGWIGTVPCWSHNSILFPGQTIPMLFADPRDINVMQTVISSNKLFGFLFNVPDHPRTYGILCEVIESTEIPLRRHIIRNSLSFKLLTRHRFLKLRRCDPDAPPSGRSLCEIKILPDVVPIDPLDCVKFRNSRTKSQDVPRTRLNECLHRTDSVCTPWPRFIYDIFNEKVLIQQIKDYFKTFSFENLPKDILSLSFWVATNLAIPTEDRLTLFATDNALMRLFLESKYIKQKNRMLSCIVCNTEICDKHEIAPMSSEGVFNNYCNLAGYVHDIMTVVSAKNVLLQGRPSMKFTWFPGYLWTIALCNSCGGHVGWRFTANTKNLRPQEFWGLLRKSLVNSKTS